MINEKDRGQLLRMAGNIACGLIGHTIEINIPAYAAELALETLKAVDAKIADENRKGD